MKLSTCPNGHFYDADKYASCPYCVPQDEAEAAAFSHLLSEFLRTESEEARRVFLQRYFMCCPVAQVADHFGFSESRVKSMLLRTRTRLAKYLESEGWTK